MAVFSPLNGFFNPPGSTFLLIFPDAEHFFASFYLQKGSESRFLHFLGPILKKGVKKHDFIDFFENEPPKSRQEINFFDSFLSI